ncbi:D-sedoheptulose-7-phosphate isomerase [Nocardia grenadensis]|uniref:D-sedoheptulose-7-phosphate isomerase n=1 Tax=Nocardia grenadensis TaxID=931537 RepID=UPI003D74BBE3
MTSNEAGALLDELAACAQVRAAESVDVRTRALAANAEPVAAAAREMARRFTDGGRLFVFGNGGSATDAATVATLFARPPDGIALPAWSLSADEAVLTAVGDDCGFESVFARQLAARGQSGDIAVAISGGGDSPDLLAGLAEARRRGMYTIGFAGRDGGGFVHGDTVDRLLVVDSRCPHRIHETQALLGYALWLSVHQHGAVGG